MTGPLIRYDLSLPCYFSYPPAPGVVTRPMIPRREARALYMRGETGQKHDGSPRLLTAHNTTHLDVPFHFYEQGQDLAAVLNAPGSVADRPCLAQLVLLAGQPGQGSFTREGCTYQEAIAARHLPPLETLRQVEALLILTGFGQVMAQPREGQFTPHADGFYHVPYLAEDAVGHILAAGLKLVGLDSNTVEPQLSVEPHRMGSDAHFRLLGHEPPVLILEGLGGAGLVRQVGFAPSRVLLHVVPRRANAAGADAAPSRVFAYFYRDDPQGLRL
ncbi:MAG TPA: cyclase family protein, partial [bacterium]|nr:cyclase family protein [bacterium]